MAESAHFVERGIRIRAIWISPAWADPAYKKVGACIARFGSGAPHRPSESVQPSGSRPKRLLFHRGRKSKYWRLFWRLSRAVAAHRGD